MSNTKIFYQVSKIDSNRKPWIVGGFEDVKQALHQAEIALADKAFFAVTIKRETVTTSTEGNGGNHG